MKVYISFANEFTRTLDKRSPGKAKRVRVAMVVCRMMTKKVITFNFGGKQMDTISYCTG